MLTNNQITVVFQGAIDAHQLATGTDDGRDFLYNVERTRQALPHAKIILSTWRHMLPEQYDSAVKLGIDQLVLNDDPGGLPNIKFGYDVPNNVNRQIVSASAGLKAVTTSYALKLRTDSYLTSDQLLAVYQHYQDMIPSMSEGSVYSPLVVPNLFTIDPHVFEHMAYHISDWAQFGQTPTLQLYWSVPLMLEEEATYFERHAQATEVNFADNTFRTRLAVEQHIATHYAKLQGYTIPTQYNELDQEILQHHKAFLATHVIVLDVQDFGLVLPKYQWAVDDEFMALNCLTHADWYAHLHDYWSLSQPDTALLQTAATRRELKRAARLSAGLSAQFTDNVLGRSVYPSSTI